MPEPDLRAELRKTEVEPLLPIEKKLIGWSLAIGVGLLVVLAILNQFLPRHSEHSPSKAISRLNSPSYI
jgi:hypothetical protein